MWIRYLISIFALLIWAFSDNISKYDYISSILNDGYILIVINFIFILIFTLIFYDLSNHKVGWFNKWIEKRLKFINIDITTIKKNSSKSWRDVVSYLETTHHVSIISKIKKLESDDFINIKKFDFDFDFNTIFLHRLREFIILFEAILNKMNHKEFKINHIDESYKNTIETILHKLYILKYKYKLYLQFYNLFYTILPFFVSILLLFFLLFNSIKIDDYFYFFIGISILLFSYRFLYIVDSLINISIFSSNINPNLIIKIFYIIFFSSILTLLILFGIHLIELPSSNFSNIFHFFKSILFLTQIKGLDEILKQDILNDVNIENYLFTIKIIVLFTVSTILYKLIITYVTIYDQFYYEQKIRKYLLPPELLKILSMVFLSVGFMAYLYINISSPPKIVTIDNNNSYVSIADVNMTQTIVVSSLKNLEDKAESIENIFPFSIFLIMLGTLLSISTKDVMENYFTGLSLKVNSPYDEGDRIKIGDYGILEVREIGTRSDEFYEIETNSIISIPHKKLSEIDIKNYTRPTLDYREDINIYIIDNTLINSNIPRESEKLLLLSAFINTGVKIPKIDKNIYNNEFLKEFKEFKKEKKYSELEKDEEFKNIIKKSWDYLNENKENKNLFKNLFIGRLPFKEINNNKSNTTFLIKKSILAIIVSVIEYQEIFSKLNISSDKNGIRRKYNIFKNKTKKELEEISTVLVNISFYYYMLSNRLWELREKQTSLIQKKKIDKAMTEILAVPRVTSAHYVDNATLFWKSTLLVTLELTEEGKETIHHINMYIDELYDKFFIRKYSRKPRSLRRGLIEKV